MAKKQKPVDLSSSALTLEGQPTPVSGERVTMPSARSKFVRPPSEQSRSETARIGQATKTRRNWEQTPEGQKRTSNPMDGGVTGVDGTKWTRGQAYFERNRAVDGPRVYDVQLPGMADPDAAPRPPKWEELSANTRAHTERALRLRGTSIEGIARDMGTQLDQAHTRAWAVGTDKPYASDFYERGSEPRDRVDTSAQELGISPLIHAQMNAFTSPNTKFSVVKKTGEKKFPNDEAASHVVRFSRQGRPVSEFSNQLSTTGSGTGRAQGYVTNMRKAASAMEQHAAGVAPADWRFGKDGKSDAFSGSPKTGPYANSWNDMHPQYAVGDVHTAGGGAFPHHKTTKVTKLADGTKRKHKSEREESIDGVPFSHAAVDYGLRQAMKIRSMGSTRTAQATQWGEEQLQRGEAGLRGAPKAADVYQKPQPKAPTFPDGGVAKQNRSMSRQHEEVIADPGVTPDGKKIPPKEGKWVQDSLF